MKKGCNGRLHTLGDNVVAINGAQHFHEPIVEACNVKLITNDTDCRICSIIDGGPRPPKRKKAHLKRDDKIFSVPNQVDSMELIP